MNTYSNKEETFYIKVIDTVFLFLFYPHFNPKLYVV